MSLATYKVWGEISGIITGGIGRFELATGTFRAEIDGIIVGQTQIAYFGTFEGTVVIPD